MLGVMGVILGGSSLSFEPDEYLAPSDATSWITSLIAYNPTQGTATRPTPINRMLPEGRLLRGDFIVSLVKSFCGSSDPTGCIRKPSISTFGDTCKTNGYFAYVETAHARGWLANDSRSVSLFDKNADCYSSTGKFFWPMIPIKRGEAAKILWSLAWNEMYHQFSSS